MLDSIAHTLYHVFGIAGSGPYYGFWSGAGSDLGEVTLIGAFWMAYRKHNCHVKGCWRLQRHPVEGTPYVVCHKHHPDVPDGHATHKQILAAHQEANQ